MSDMNNKITQAMALVIGEGPEGTYPTQIVFNAEGLASAIREYESVNGMTITQVFGRRKYAGLPYFVDAGQLEPFRIIKNTDWQLVEPQDERDQAKELIDEIASAGNDIEGDLFDEVGPVCEEINRRVLHRDVTHKGRRYRIHVEVL